LFLHLLEILSSKQFLTGAYYINVSVFICSHILICVQTSSIEERISNLRSLALAVPVLRGYINEVGK
jgi:hypothetical protein